MYKVMFDNGPSGVLYVLKRVAIQVTEDGRIGITLLKPGQRHSVLQSVSFGGSVDKVVEPERKMFWLVFGSTLRAMGVIK